MTKKIFRSIFTVAVSVLVVCFVLIIGVLYGYFNSIQENHLKEECTLVAEGVNKGGIRYLENLKQGTTRITWIEEDGKVIFDSERDASGMENHRNREEVKEAVKKGTGESLRYSTTFTEKTMYYAELLEDGTVIRVSVSQATVVSLLYGMIQPILIVLLIALIISAIIARRISKKIVGPLNKLDLDNPLENDVYDEISPLLTLIEKQHKQIDSHVRELDRKQNEFLTVVGNMNEGLVLLNRGMKVLSINNSASLFFSADDNCIGKDFITIERAYDIESVIENALEYGTGEIQVSRNGREYQLNVSRIEDKGSVAGAAILIFDITDKVFAERNRREFTANVSHELKTPLQSIMGSAELIESGLVDKNDMGRFVGNIRSEASRLVAMIDDIIRLSQLDEQEELPFEQVDIHKVSAAEIRALKGAAEAKNVSVELAGESVMIDGVPQLLHEIIYNLCDNAIKYNVRGGKVIITTTEEASRVVLKVEDTGIGIAPEHQSRIFERFYRVDKSHSKETGGTGLGLSIVKHAAEYMNGKIEVKSSEKAGTVITISFMKQK